MNSDMKMFFSATHRKTNSNANYNGIPWPKFWEFVQDIFAENLFWLWYQQLFAFDSAVLLLMLRSFDWVSILCHRLIITRRFIVVGFSILICLDCGHKCRLCIILCRFYLNNNIKGHEINNGFIWRSSIHNEKMATQISYHVLSEKNKEVTSDTHKMICSS